MRNLKNLLNAAIIINIMVACSSNGKTTSLSTSIFCTGEHIATVTDPKLDEISGIAASTKNKDCFWVNNDSGDKARIFLINTQGQTVATINFTNIHQRDWEDIATATDPNSGLTYIYIAETGDNRAEYDDKYIYKLEEPKIDVEKLNQTLELPVGQKITFQYKDGNRDAETLLVENSTNDIYIVSKREKRIHVYLLPYPQSTTEKLIAKKVQTLHFRKATAGDISDDGREILIKNYDNIYYWERSEGETIAQALAKKPKIIPYTWEPQGESIAWLNDGSAFVTISEKGRENMVPKLYMYRKK